MSRLESLATLPKLVVATAGTATSAIASGATQLALPEVHWAQLSVWICTALAGLGTMGLAGVRGYIELSKFITSRRRAAKYRAKALAAKEDARRLP